MDRKQLTNEVDMLGGNINRMCVTHDSNELDLMYITAKSRLSAIYNHNKERLYNELKTD